VEEGEKKILLNQSGYADAGLSGDALVMTVVPGKRGKIIARNHQAALITSITRPAEPGLVINATETGFFKDLLSMPEWTCRPKSPVLPGKKLNERCKISTGVSGVSAGSPCSKPVFPRWA
jgi:hypothetical protein